MNAPRPISILIGALGGEGGGVLARWLIEAAEACGYPAQATSIPGVAQRTGATTYYLEVFPVKREALGGRDVVLALSPVPGEIDLMISSELLEAGRAAQAGFVSPERTVLIASTHRTYTVAEKSGMGDGRFDSATLGAALKRFSRDVVLFDMAAAARASDTAISAVMLGAIAASGRLPMPKAAFEDAIRAAGKVADASIAGFVAGYAAVAAHGDGGAAPAPRAGLRARAVPPVWRDAIEALRRRFPESLCPLIEEGCLRQADYQNRAYAELYLARVERVFRAEQAAASAVEFPVTAAFARFLALWMSYEDVIRVADLKSRASRYARVRAEAAARPENLMRVIEFMRPGIEEWCAILPGGLARRLRRWAAHNGRAARFGFGLKVRTTSLHGLLMLRALAALRRWRPYTSRYHEEQGLIERWLAAVADALARSPALALELALCGRLIKGYGETHARGKANFLHILDAVLPDPVLGSDAQRASVIRAAREAALADPEGRALAQSLAQHGLAPVRARARPIVWHKSRPAATARR